MEQPSRFSNEPTATFSMIDAAKIPDESIRYVLIAARHKGKWLFCRHAGRQSWELPGGKREQGESVRQAADRELREETGAEKFSLIPVTAYSIIKSDVRHGMLYMAEVTTLNNALHHEIAEVKSSDRLPDKLRFPDIQPGLFAIVQDFVRLDNLLS